MGYCPFFGSCCDKDFWFLVVTVSLCRDRSWSGQDFSCRDSVFRVATEFVQARILLSQQRILCCDRVLVEPDELCRDRTFWVTTEPAVTENYIAHGRARRVRQASACDNAHSRRPARATTRMTGVCVIDRAHDRPDMELCRDRELQTCPVSKKKKKRPRDLGHHIYTPLRKNSLCPLPLGMACRIMGDQFV